MSYEKTPRRYPNFSKTEGPLLATKAMEGDRDAFEELVSKYQSRIYRFILQKLKNPELAEEATQETFSQALANINQCRSADKFEAWLFRIANNKALKIIRYESRRDPRFLLKLTAAKKITPQLKPESLNTNPEFELLIKRERTRVQEAIQQLPEIYKAVITRHYLQGMSYKEIAQDLNIAEGTVMSRMDRGRKLLKNLLLEEKGKAA